MVEWLYDEMMSFILARVLLKSLQTEWRDCYTDDSWFTLLPIEDW